MNDVDFPVADVLAGIDAALAAGLTPVKVNMVVKRGTNDDGILEMAERFRGTGVILRFIEYMDVGATNGWQLDEVVPSAEVVSAIDAALAARARRARLPRRGRLALALPRRRRRDRPDLVGHATVLPRLHARTPLGRGQALHLPVREPRARPARPAAQRCRPTPISMGSCAASGARATTATRSCARQGTPLDLPKVEMSHIGG